VLEYDTGDDKEEGVLDVSENWDLWWKQKETLNNKLKTAIILNNVKEATELLQPDEQGNQADTNFKIQFKNFILTPLLLAI